METAVFDVLKQSPLALVLFWMIWVFNKKDEKRTEELRNIHEKMLDVIENNTKAITGVNISVKENTKATETLSNRIYDVLVQRNGRNHQ